MKTILTITITLFVTIVAFTGLQILIKPFEVFDVSMKPTFKEGDFIIVNKLAYIAGEPKPGDVIVLYSPGTPGQSLFNPFPPPNTAQYIKRIIAVPGDRVSVADEKVFVNGHTLAEPYIMQSPDYYCAEQTIPEGKYFVLGDNRNSSYDSHRGWLTAREEIIGPVWFRYWTDQYPDIHLMAVPVCMVVIGAFSKDMILGFLKKFRNNKA